MYSEENFKTKKELKKAVGSGRKISIFPPGLGTPKLNGSETLEGPWYPEPHRWYAQVEMKDGFIIKVR